MCGSGEESENLKVYRRTSTDGWRTPRYDNSSLDLWLRWAKQEAQRAAYRAPEYNVPPFWGIGQGGHFCLLFSPKNTNLVEDVEILHPVKFCWIPFSGFRIEVENVSANQRPGRPSCFSDRPEKHKLSRGRWDLASCQVSLNSVQRFQRRSRKCPNQSETRAAILFFRSARKTQTWKRTFRSCFLSSYIKFCSAVSEEKSKISQPIRRQGSHLVFRSARKNTNLVEDVEILLPVKFRRILFSGFKREAENVQTNQRPGRQSCFSDRPEKHKLSRERWDLASCQVSLNSVQRFQRRSRKCPNQSETRAAILFFRSARKTQTWRRTLRTCFLSSYIKFCSAVSEEKSKMSQPIRGQGSHLVFPIGP